MTTEPQAVAQTRSRRKAVSPWLAAGLLAAAVAGAVHAEPKGFLETIRSHREKSGRSMDGFGIQAQAQYSGGNPERWRSHAQRWEALGATHLAIATHNAGPTDVDGHLARVGEYLAAVRA